MDKLMPPPNGSPEEIEAWNNMMDTMVTFIRASTNLMNTITLKVRPVPGGPAIPVALGGNMMSLMESCEPECEMCIPKPKSPCGVCTAKDPARRSLSDQKPAKAPSAPTSKALVDIPPTPEGDSKEAPGEDAPVIPEAEEELAPPEEEEGDATLQPAPPENEEESAPPDKEPASSESKEVPTEPTETASTPETGCVCSTLRAKKLEEKEKEADMEAFGNPEEPPQEPLEHLCACGPTDGNHASMVQDMVLKLANAQQEIEILQEEMMKLQRMDSTRKMAHGGPNPAALYREIMRNNEVQDPCPRDRASQRTPQQARPRFQTQNSVNLGLDCSARSGNRSMTNQPRGRFQTNTSGFDMSIPIEGMQLPEGFIGIPCENNQAGSNYGLSQAMPRQMQQQVSMQAMQQRSMYMSMQQQNMGASRQGMLTRIGSQGRANQIPARGNSALGSSSGFRNYPDASNAGRSPGFRTSQNFPDQPDSSSRRVMCGPPPQPQSGCNSCPNR